MAEILRCNVCDKTFSASDCARRDMCTLCESSGWWNDENFHCCGICGFFKCVGECGISRDLGFVPGNREEECTTCKEVACCDESTGICIYCMAARVTLEAKKNPEYTPEIIRTERTSTHMIEIVRDELGFSVIATLLRQKDEYEVTYVLDVQEAENVLAQYRAETLPPEIAAPLLSSAKLPQLAHSRKSLGMTLDVYTHEGAWLVVITRDRDYTELHRVRVEGNKNDVELKIYDLIMPHMSEVINTVAQE